MADLAVLSPMRIEARAVGGAVKLVGIGPNRALASGQRFAGSFAPGTALAVAGVAGGLHPSLRPGDLVVATEVRTVDGELIRELPAAELLADDLRSAGHRVIAGPVLSSPKLVRGAQRASMASTSDAVAVDMESAWLAGKLLEYPLAVVRAISDTAERGGLRGGWPGLRSLRRLRPSLERWAAAVGPHAVMLASPRSFCAGVERAIEIVERAIERYGAPVYVRRQIVHNAHVVADLEAKGAVFVTELDEVPADATVVLAAHGVSPAVRDQAAQRGNLAVIDATCPLVAKVHHEARRFASQDLPIVLIGHADHEEIEGTLGEAPGRIRLVEGPEDVEALDLDPAEPVAYLTQTTLATDETAAVVSALQARFSRLVGPNAHDICYATQNRQDAVRALAGRCDLILVVGSTNSSNTARLVEVARRAGCRAELIEDESQLRLEWFDGVTTVGLTAGASAPESLVQQVLDALGRLGPVEITEHRTTVETIHFSLPPQVR